jgi:hypothetical protein
VCRNLYQSLERSSFQEETQHHWRIYPSDAIHAESLWISLLLDPLQMGQLLGTQDSSIPFECDDQHVEGQFIVQIILLLLAVISVPWMLLVKPLTLRHLHKKKMAAQPSSLVEDEHEPAHHGGDHGGHDDHGEDGEVRLLFSSHSNDLLV